MIKILFILIRETVLKLRLPLEYCATETRLIRTNQPENDTKNEKESSVQVLKKVN